MTSLAKAILANKHKGSTDEFGIPLKTSSGEKVEMKPQYLVARTFLLEKMDPRYDPDSVNRIHLYQGEMYIGRDPIQPDKELFYKLTGVVYKVPDYIQTAYWRELKRKLPTVNTHVYKITEGMWWDKVKGEIFIGNREEINERVDNPKYRVY